jgi:diaminopimelate decarboxylase
MNLPVATEAMNDGDAALPDWVARRVPLFPASTVATPTGLTIGGCSLGDLAADYGTPLYVYDVAELDAAAAEYREALYAHYPGASAVTFAGKALLLPEVARWVDEQELWLDCTGAGELGVAQAADFPVARTLVHGVNKSMEDLRAAVRRAAVIVVDNRSELRRLLPLLAEARGGGPALWLRVRPGVAVDTHAYRQTGQSDSKFGMDGAEVRLAVQMALQAGATLQGIHFHQGSHFHDPVPVAPALETVLDLIAALRDEFGWLPEVLSPGGGWGVPYHEEDLPHQSIGDYVHFVSQALVAGCTARGLPLPRLQLEPGRSLVARAGVALYSVGTVKQSGGRRWLLVDGGMADNPRPALYGARYSALPVAHGGRELAGPATVGGPFCESGDVLLHDLPLPMMEEGELLAVPASGAYQVSMASNYNGARRPAVLFVANGRASVVQRRERVEDLLLREEAPPRGVVGGPRDA